MPHSQHEKPGTREKEGGRVKLSPLRRVAPGHSRPAAVSRPLRLTRRCSGAQVDPVGERGLLDEVAVPPRLKAPDVAGRPLLDRAHPAGAAQRSQRGGSHLLPAAVELQGLAHICGRGGEERGVKGGGARASCMGVWWGGTRASCMSVWGEGAQGKLYEGGGQGKLYAHAAVGPVGS